MTWHRGRLDVSPLSPTSVKLTQNINNCWQGQNYLAPSGSSYTDPPPALLLSAWDCLVLNTLISEAVPAVRLHIMSLEAPEGVGFWVWDLQKVGHKSLGPWWCLRSGRDQRGEVKWKSSPRRAGESIWDEERIGILEGKKDGKKLSPRRMKKEEMEIEKVDA